MIIGTPVKSKIENHYISRRGDHVSLEGIGKGQSILVKELYRDTRIAWPQRRRYLNRPDDVQTVIDTGTVCGDDTPRWWRMGVVGVGC